MVAEKQCSVVTVIVENGLKSAANVAKNRFLLQGIVQNGQIARFMCVSFHCRSIAVRFLLAATIVSRNLSISLL